MRESVLLSPFQAITEGVFSFAAASSIGCGGFAKAAYFPRTVEEASSLVTALKEGGIPYLVLGNLTNVLPPDKGTEKVIVSTKRLRGITREKEGLFALAGTGSGELLAFMKREGLTGAEFFYGIPCTLGGALYMNAGAGGKYLAEIVEEVLVLRENRLRALSAAACGYAYKKSVFMENGDLILGAKLRLEEDGARIEERIAYYKARRAHLPTERSMGCVFKNPEGHFAGDLIERSGLKGLRIGGARISPKHANFIVNEGGATEKEIRALITLIKNAVRSQYGVELQEEIRYVE